MKKISVCLFYKLHMQKTQKLIEKKNGSFLIWCGVSIESILKIVIEKFLRLASSFKDIEYWYMLGIQMPQN